jgi:hypothetical protein
MQLFRSARWLLPALLLSLLPTSARAEVFHGAGLATHMLPAYGQPQTQPDAAAPAQPQTTDQKTPANRKHMNVHVGPLKMHIPVSGKRAAPVTAPGNGGGPADVRIKGTNTGAQEAQQPRTPAPGTRPQPEGLSTVAIPGIAGGAATRNEIPTQQTSSEEKVKPFTIKGNDQQAYQPPQGIDPANGSRRSEDRKQPITFRWTPVIPKPQGQVTYRVSVWQLMQGQTGAQAMKANQPIITKDVDNITELEVRNLPVAGCGPQNACGFVWNVQALDRKVRFIKGYNDSRKVAAFRIDAQSGTVLVQRPKRMTTGDGSLNFPADTYLGCCGLAISEVGSEGIFDRWGNLYVESNSAQKPSAGVGGRPAQVDLEAGKLKQNPKYARVGGEPSTGTNGKPQPADNSITAINITLPANPDDAKNVNSPANEGTGSANSISGLSHDDVRGATGKAVVRTPTPSPSSSTCEGQTLASNGTCTLATSNPNGNAAQIFTVTNTGGVATGGLDTRPPKAQQPGQERGVINKGLPITNPNIERTEPNVVKDATDRGPVNQRNAPARLNQNGKAVPQATVTPSSSTPIPIEHDPGGIATHGTTNGGPTPQAKPAKKKSKIGIHMTF